MKVCNNCHFENRDEANFCGYCGSSIKNVYENNYTFSTENESFQFEVKDVFVLTGRGVVATGTIHKGTLNLGDVVNLPSGMTTEVLGIENFNKTMSTAVEGEQVGILLRGVEKNDIKKGDIISK